MSGTKTLTLPAVSSPVGTPDLQFQVQMREGWGEVLLTGPSYRDGRVTVSMATRLSREQLGTLGRALLVLAEGVKGEA